MATKFTAWLGAATLTALVGVAQAATADKTLDRPALIKLADDYIAALVAHTPAKVPLASDVKTVENAKRINPGEGLWKSATAGPTEFKIVVPDAVSQQVGGMVGRPGGQGHVGQRRIHGTGRGHARPVGNEQVADIMRLVVAVQDRGGWIQAHACGAASPQGEAVFNMRRSFESTR